MKASSRYYALCAQFKMHSPKGKKFNEPLSKQNKMYNVTITNFIDISAYGNLHASTVSKCLVKVRELIIICNLVFEACIERYCCTCTIFYICNILWIRRC